MIHITLALLIFRKQQIQISLPPKQYRGVSVYYMKYDNRDHEIIAQGISKLHQLTGFPRTYIN